MRKRDIKVGTRVRNLVASLHIPKGSIGIIQETWAGGFVVRWIHVKRARKLPERYSQYKVPEPLTGALLETFTENSVWMLGAVRKPRKK